MFKNKKQRKPDLKEAILIMTAVIVVILISLRISLELVPALMFGTGVAALSAFYLGGKWEQIESGILSGIANGMGAILILIVIGAVIGTWILGGTIQTLIYYGLKILTPNIFLPTGFLLCAIISTLIGSSFGTIATMGIVLMGVGEGLGVPAAMTAGMIISGALFGDTISPMSDSVNLTAAMTKTPLFSHVKAMFQISLPGVFISLIAYYILGKRNVVAQVDLTTINNILEGLESNFNISLLTLVPALIVVVLLAMKMPALAALTLSFVSAGIFAMITQNASFREVINVIAIGYEPETRIELLDSLLAQGGVSSMMETVSIILLGTAMGGILEEFRVLETLLDSLMTRIKRPRDLILATMAGAYLMLLATGEMMVSIILPGRTLQPAYTELGIDSSVLSRTLGVTATLGCGVLPWGVLAVYARGILNIGFDYVKYAYLPFIAPLTAVLFAVVGFATYKTEEVKEREYKSVT